MPHEMLQSEKSGPTLANYLQANWGSKACGSKSTHGRSADRETSMTRLSKGKQTFAVTLDLFLKGRRKHREKDIEHAQISALLYKYYSRVRVRLLVETYQDETVAVFQTVGACEVGDWVLVQKKA